MKLMIFAISGIMLYLNSKYRFWKALIGHKRRNYLAIRVNFLKLNSFLSKY